MSEPISILIVDDQEIVRKGIGLLLATQQNVEIVGQAANGIEAIEAAQSLNPDVILMDLIMPEMGGIEATREIMSANPRAHILILTSDETFGQVYEAMQAGACGYRFKDATLPELLAAIRQVDQGDISLQPALARKILSGMPPSDEDAHILASLSAREIEVLCMVGRGFSNARIAEMMQLTNATVRNYVSRIMSKIEVTNRVQAMLFALRKGLVSLDDIDDLNPPGAHTVP